MDLVSKGTSSLGGGHGCRLWAEVALVLARDRLTVAARAGFFHSDHRLATQALPDRIYTLRVPIDKIQLVPLLPTHRRAAKQCEIKDLSCLVVSSGR